jgi:hypothetical protein
LPFAVDALVGANLINCTHLAGPIRQTIIAQKSLWKGESQEESETTWSGEG